MPMASFTAGPADSSLLKELLGIFKLGACCSLSTASADEIASPPIQAPESREAVRSEEKQHTHRKAEKQ